ncbi:unnamed protein product, partial [Didymodactylos carnosus]
AAGVQSVEEFKEFYQGGKKRSGSTSAGSLACKKILCIPWSPPSDSNQLDNRQSIAIFVAEAMNFAVSNDYETKLNAEIEEAYHKKLLNINVIDENSVKICINFDKMHAIYPWNVIRSVRRENANESLPDIIKIERIQNERWYKQYAVHRDDFNQRYVKHHTNLEKLLVHGCLETSALQIIQDGFNTSHAGVNGICSTTVTFT